MNTSFPFHLNQPDVAGATIYHTHPKCRIAEGIAAELRIDGIGEELEECPFCFLLSQFQANRALRSNRLARQANSFRAGWHHTSR